MRLTSLLLIPLYLAACATHHNDTAQEKLATNAERQQSYADDLTQEYLDCIDSIDGKTAIESYANKNTRRDVIMESCSTEATRFTIVQKQAYDNACRVSGKSSASCDAEAVSKGKRDTDLLLQEARKRIDRTSASYRQYRTQ